MRRLVLRLPNYQQPMITKEKLDRMDQCRHLLDAPAPEVCSELIEEIRRLTTANERMKSMLARIGYPSRGTPDETADVCAFASEIQEAWTLGDLSENAPVLANADEKSPTP